MSNDSVNNPFNVNSDVNCWE